MNTYESKIIDFNLVENVLELKNIIHYIDQNYDYDDKYSKYHILRNLVTLLYSRCIKGLNYDINIDLYKRHIAEFLNMYCNTHIIDKLYQIYASISSSKLSRFYYSDFLIKYIEVNLDKNFIFNFINNKDEFTKFYNIVLDKIESADNIGNQLYLFKFLYEPCFYIDSDIYLNRIISCFNKIYNKNIDRQFFIEYVLNLISSKKYKKYFSTIDYELSKYNILFMSLFDLIYDDKGDILPKIFLKIDSFISQSVFQPDIYADGSLVNALRYINNICNCMEQLSNSLINFKNNVRDSLYKKVLKFYMFLFSIICLGKCKLLLDNMSNLKYLYDEEDFVEFVTKFNPTGNLDNRDVINEFYIYCFIKFLDKALNNDIVFDYISMIYSENDISAKYRMWCKDDCNVNFVNQNINKFKSAEYIKNITSCKDDDIKNVYKYFTTFINKVSLFSTKNFNDNLYKLGFSDLICINSNEYKDLIEDKYVNNDYGYGNIYRNIFVVSSKISLCFIKFVLDLLKYNKKDRKKFLDNFFYYMKFLGNGVSKSFLYMERSYRLYIKYLYIFCLFIDKYSFEFLGNIDQFDKFSSIIRFVSSKDENLSTACIYQIVEEYMTNYSSVSEYTEDLFKNIVNLIK